MELYFPSKSGFSVIMDNQHSVVVLLTKKFQSPEMAPSLGWKKDPSKLQLKNGNQICTAFSLLLKRVICLTSYSWRLELSRFLSLFNRKKYIIGNQTVAEENLVLHFGTNLGGLQCPKLLNLVTICTAVNFSNLMLLWLPELFIR